MQYTKEIFETLYSYMGSFIWLGLFVVSALYIIFTAEKKSKTRIILWVVMAILFVYNSSALWLAYWAYEQEVYYRFFWLVPTALVCAVALVKFIFSNHKVWLKGLVVLAVFGLLFFGEDNFLEKTPKPDNLYQVYDDVFDISSCINEHKDKDMPVLALPQELELMYRTIDSKVSFAMGRSLYIRNEEEDGTIKDEGDKVYLRRFIKYGECPNPVLLKTTIAKYQVDFIVLAAGYDVESYMESIGCKKIGVSASYQIFEVLYNDYDRVDDSEKIAKIKEEISLKEDEYTIEIPGLTEEKEFLVLNDIHQVYSDETIDSKYASKINDRFEFAKSDEGITSADMWNEVSSIVASFGADQVLLAGDIMDFYSDIGAYFTRQGLSKFYKTQDVNGRLEMARDSMVQESIYLRADHDIGPWYNDSFELLDTYERSKTITGEFENVLVQNYEDFFVVGWNNSTSNITEEGLEQVKSVFETGKPVILVTHVPLDSKIDSSFRNDERCFDSSGNAKLWGENCLYKPYGPTKELMEMIYGKDSPVVAVISGHLHYQYETEIMPGVKEYVLNPGFKGYVSKFKVVAK